MSEYHDINDLPEGKAEEGFDHSEPKSGIVAILGALIVITVVVVVIFVQFYYGRVRESQVYSQQQAPVSEQLTAIHQRENKELNSYGYIDRNAGAVRLPIDRAIDVYVQEYRDGKLFYPTTPYAPKPLEPAAPAAAPATPNAPK